MKDRATTIHAPDLKKGVSEIHNEYAQKLKSLEIQAKGLDLKSVTESIEIEAEVTNLKIRELYSPYKTEIRHETRRAKSALRKPVEQRLQDALANYQTVQQKELSNIIASKNVEIIPLQSEIARMGKSAAFNESEACALEKDALELEKNLMPSLAHNNFFYGLGHLAFSAGDGWMLYSTLADAGAGSGKTILLFLPIICITMALLAHNLAEAIYTNNTKKQLLFGIISGAILTTLASIRLFYFHI